MDIIRPLKKVVTQLVEFDFRGSWYFTLNHQLGAVDVLILQ